MNGRRAEGGDSLIYLGMPVRGTRPRLTQLLLSLAPHTKLLVFCDQSRRPGVRKCSETHSCPYASAQDTSWELERKRTHTMELSQSRNGGSTRPAAHVSHHRCLSHFSACRCTITMSDLLSRSEENAPCCMTVSRSHCPALPQRTTTAGHAGGEAAPSNATQATPQI